MNYKDFYKMQEQLPHLNHLMVMMDTNSFEGFLKLLVEAVDIKLSRLEEIDAIMAEGKPMFGRNTADPGMQAMERQALGKQTQELKDFKKALEGITVEKGE